VPPCLLQLAATHSPQPGELFGELLPFLAALVGFIVLGWIGILMLRRSFRNNGRHDSDSFSLQSLRQMHANGELTKAEFEQARSAVLGQAHPMGSDTAAGDAKTPPQEDQTST
jgi:putative Mn2+ efflux pump MntP